MATFTPRPSEQWRAAGSFLRAGSVVPVRAPVLCFGLDGTASGVVTQRLDDEIRAEIDGLGIVWAPPPWPGPVSRNCSRRIPRTLACGAKVTYFCTEPSGHSGGHEARGSGDVVLARMAARRPSPRKRTA